MAFGTKGHADEFECMGESLKPLWWPPLLSRKNDKKESDRLRGNILRRESGDIKSLYLRVGYSVKLTISMINQ